MKTKRHATGSGQLVALVVIAVVLAAGILVLDRYNAGSRDMLTVETRGMQTVRALTEYKLETGGYPDDLDKLVPKFLTAVGSCPSGGAIEYRLNGSDYVLTCQKVVFKVQPYSYSSRTRSWDG
jgi:type II secretory pathway pseudopilin PulG